jgi:hypothetical protein
MKEVEKEMQALLSCFKKEAIFPSIDCKPIKIPEEKINTTCHPIALSALSIEDVVHMVDHVVSAPSATRMQKSNRWQC